MNKAYKDILNQLHFSEEQKVQMVEDLLNAQDHSLVNSRRRPIKRVLAVVCAAAVVLTVGAGAVYTGLASDAFAAVFGTAHTEIIDQIGRPIGVSDTDHGVTITADAILGDRHNLNVVFTLTKDDGTAWNLSDTDNLLFEHSDLWLARLGGSHGGAWFVDQDPSDAQLQYVIQTTIDDEKGIPMGNAKAELRDLYVYDMQSGQRQLLVSGKWILRFDVQYEDSSVSLLEMPIQVETSAGIATIDEILISSVGFRINGHYDTLNEQTQQMIDRYQAESGKEPEDSPFRRMMNLSVILNLKDGEIIDLGRNGGSANIQDQTFTLSGCYENEIYDLSDIQSVTIQGVTLPMSNNP